MTRHMQFSRDLAPSSRSDTLIDLPIAQLTARLHEKSLKPSELVEAHIARIEQVNPAINALIEDCYDRARSEARAADETLAKCDDPQTLPPLFGIPCTIKEFFGVKGMPQTSGLLCNDGGRAQLDCTVVARLRQAGAIILGVTNVPEGGLWMETHNLLYGRTRNPWNLSHTAGGSSGGEGAIVASGGAPFGMGSDIGGSIRIPAAFCGTVGHKPSGGLIPLTGHLPGPLGDSQFLVGGPLCRSVSDILPILRVLAGPDGQDHTCQALPLGDPASVDLRRVRVFPMPEPMPVRIAPSLREAADAAVAALRERGANTCELDPSLVRGSFALWMTAMRSAASFDYAAVLSGGSGIDLASEFLRLPFGKSRYLLPSLVTVLAERLVEKLPRSVADPSRLLERLARLRDTLDETFGDDGVLIYPPYTRPAPRHHLPLLTPFDAGVTSLWNVLGYPSTVVPIGFSSDGLPVAVQVVARRGLDHLTIAVAAALEQRYGGWVRAEPPPFGDSRRRRPSTRTAEARASL